MLDDCLYPGDPFRSAVASFGLGTVGMLASQGLVNHMNALAKSAAAGRRHGGFHQVARFGAIYALAGSCILIWRGTWVMWDVVYERAHHCPIQKTGPRATDEHHATYSGLVSHVTAIVALVSCGLFASVLAPPAAVSVLTNAAVVTSKASSMSSRAGWTAASRSSPATTTTIMAGSSTQYHRGLHLQNRAFVSNPTTVIGRHISPRNDRVLARPSSLSLFAFGTTTGRGMPAGSGAGVMGMSSAAGTRRSHATTTTISLLQ